MKKLSFIALLSFSAQAFGQLSLNITDFGAVGDNNTLNTASIQAAIDSCYTGGGGEVLIPQGTFLSGTLFLKSNVKINIQAGGTLKGSGDPGDYPEIESPVHGMADGYRKRSLIYAENQHNVGLVGEGTFDGNSFSLPFVLTSANRPFGVRLISCTNVLYENLTMRNTAFWMMHNLDCDTVVLRNVTINNQGTGNNDGIGIDGCRFVRIHDCTVESLDDALVLKTTSTANLKDVEVWNCQFASPARVIKIGTETVGNISNIHIHDCQVVLGALPTPGEIGIALGSIDGAAIDSVVIENITLSGVQVPIVVRLGDSNRPFIDSLPPLPAGTFKNLILRNISGTSTSQIPCHITGITDHYIENLTLENIFLTVPGGTNNLDTITPIPENIAERPEFDLFGNYLPAYGIYFRHVQGLTLNNVCITAQASDARPMLYFEDVQDITQDSVCNFSSGISEAQQEQHNLVFNLLENSLKFQTQVAGTLSVFNALGQLILEKNILGDFNTIAIADNLPLTWQFKSNKGKYAFGKVKIQ